MAEFQLEQFKFNLNIKFYSTRGWTLLLVVRVIVAPVISALLYQCSDCSILCRSHQQPTTTTTSKCQWRSLRF